MKILFTFVLFVALLVATLTSAQSVEPIWLSPTSVGAKLPEVFPERGVWSNISTGIGSRSLPLVLMDSKKTLWIMFGRFDVTSRVSNAVWNYDPKTDLYRWVAGFNDTQYHERVPGELRVPSPDNWPGSRALDTIYSDRASVDSDDNIWFIPRVLGEVWMFNTTSYLFTRMKGLYEDEIDEPPRYGTQGQPSEDVWPGQTEGGCVVIDSQKNLWKIGGLVDPTGYSNTVWHFNTTSFMWTFIGGNTTQVQTVYGDNPIYGSRLHHSCDIDSEDRVWLFGGGEGDGTGRSKLFNDVWSFDTLTAQWRVEFEGVFNYRDQLLNLNASVAVRDAFDPANHPWPLYQSAFTDRIDDTLLLVGTWTDPRGGIGANDVWLFHKTLKQWKLIYGDPFNLNNTGNFSNYRTAGSVMPSRLQVSATSAQNTDGDVYIVGGIGLNDIWLIPQTNCTLLPSNNCSLNAQCIRDMLTTRCQCNDGFTGDGFTCVGPPVTPIADVPVAAPLIDESQSPSMSPSSSSQPSTTPHRKPHVSSGTMLQSSLLLCAFVLFVVSS